MTKKTLLALIAVFIVIGGAVALQSTSTSTPQAGEETPVSSQESMEGDDDATDTISESETLVLKDKIDHPAINNAPLETDFVMGKLDAPITLIEYASLSCPHCAEFHEKSLPLLQKTYIETGKLKYILRQFPLNESAMVGSMLVDCVGDTYGADRYYQHVKALFESQKRWAFDADFRKSLRAFAQAGGISPEEFKTCVNDKEREKKLLEIRKVGGEEVGVDGTPYVILNGHPHGGNRSYRAVKREIEALLKAQK